MTAFIFTLDHNHRSFFGGQRRSYIRVLGLSVRYTAAVLVGALLVGQWADVGGLGVRYLGFGFWVL